MASTTTFESFRFQAETTQLLHLMTHCLYTQRDIFLRELVANASDALDRLRLDVLTTSSLVPPGHKFEIRLKPDPTTGTLTISDSGIGMSRQELIEHIGTIARSGTREVQNSIKDSQSTKALSEFIGQFGVGFYSAFMVADRVTILTRRADSEDAIKWESAGDGTYTLATAVKPHSGTEITLYLKAADPENGIEDYTDRWKLQLIVHKYSDLIAYPIVYEGPSQEPAELQAGSESKIEKTLNSMKPIWTRSQSEVSDKDYTDFYRHMFNDPNDPLKVLSMKAEGTYEYWALLFIPSQAPRDLFYVKADAGLRLYAKRVMVMERCADLLPSYLRFIKGIVESGDLPLNISRQALQQDRHLSQIRRWLTRKVLDALNEMREKETDKYMVVWREFGKALKEGLSSDYENREKLLPLLLFESSRDSHELTTLKDYVARMNLDQRHIFYLTGDSRRAIENTPHLEMSRQKGYEVLYLSDAVDELLVQHLSEYDGKPLKSIGKGRIPFWTGGEREKLEEQLKKKEEDYAGFLQACQKRLEKYIKQMRLSIRLVDSPACLVTEEYEFSPHLERLLQKGDKSAPKQLRTMELNPIHPIVTRLNDRFKLNNNDDTIGDSIEILFELALLAEGSDIADPVRLNQLTLKLLDTVVRDSHIKM
jgi:molecular chaperone HtpG